MNQKSKMDSEYAPIVEALEQNPMDELYRELEAIASTKMLLLDNPQKTIKDISARLKQLENRTQLVYATGRKNFFDLLCNKRIELDQTRLYLEIASSRDQAKLRFLNLEREIKFLKDYHQRGSYLQEFVNWLNRDIIQMLHDAYLNQRDAQKKPDFLEEEPRDFEEVIQVSRKMASYIEDALENCSRFYEDALKEFPDHLDYRRTLPEILKKLKEEYLRFIKEPDAYLQRRDEEIMSEIRLVAKGGELLDPRDKNIPSGTLIN